MTLRQTQNLSRRGSTAARVAKAHCDTALAHKPLTKEQTRNLANRSQFWLTQMSGAASLMARIDD